MNEQAILKEHKLNDGHTLQIFQDTMSESPRSWDNLGIMAIFHKRYNFGDDVNFSADEFANWAEMEEYIKEKLKAEVCIPIYMYDHSGITINTEGFSCPWDSGQVGFIFTTPDKMRENYGENYTADDIAKARQVLLNEVKTMDTYLIGEVYGFQLLKDGKEIDGCCGFYGDDPATNGMYDHIPTELIPNTHENK
jgi:hypothetical protein